MKVSGVSGFRALGAASLPPSPVVARLDFVRRNIAQARVKGEDQVSVILQDNELDKEVVRRLKTQFGETNVQVEQSKSMKVDIKF